MRLIRSLLFLLAASLSLPSVAGRILPSNALLGELKSNDYPALAIGDQVYHAAPGLRIYDRNNLMILPVALQAGGYVLYKLDLQGNLAQLWLLNPEEEAAARQAASQ
ncbi:MAG: hypothetical protein AB7U30_07015 [Sulfuricellaceae bacterium]|jgi:hypothetical protein